MSSAGSHSVLRLQQVAREGTKKTVFTNYMELCKAMNRQPEHVQMFLMAELGTSGSLDGQQRLVVKGRFQPKAFEGVLRRYVNEYVPLAYSGLLTESCTAWMPNFREPAVVAVLQGCICGHAQ